MIVLQVLDHVDIAELALAELLERDQVAQLNLSRLEDPAMLAMERQSLLVFVKLERLLQRTPELAYHLLA